MEEKKTLCLALGLGAIGRTVSGYAMTKAGIHVTYGDIAEEQIEVINHDGGYWLGTADIYSKQLKKEFITNVNAAHVKSAEAERAALHAEYMISAVGPKGFRALLPQIMEWFQMRNAISNSPLYYMVFENDYEAVRLLYESVERIFGERPPWLHIAKCSIERMSKIEKFPDLGMTAIGETYFPIIAERKDMEGSGLSKHSDLIELVDDVERYYFRKLLTNNLGHAVLGYAGSQKGYKTTREAITDPEIYELLRETLFESGQAVCAEWGFTREEMERHLDILMLRFENPAFEDDLERLCREPIRKISPKERIVFPIKLCYQYHIVPDGLQRTLYHAIRYENSGVEWGRELLELRQRIGDEGILKTICAADEQFLEDYWRLTRE